MPSLVDSSPVAPGLSGETIRRLTVELNMDPVEVYLAAELSRLSRRPFDELLRAFRSNQGRSWGTIAAQYGIRPGTQPFLQLQSRCKARLDQMMGKSQQRL